MDFEKNKVSELFYKLFFPTLIGMLSISAVTTIDGIFIGHGIGSDGIAAVNLCIPLLMLMTGLGLMLGAGSSVIISVCLAQKDADKARENMTHTYVMVSALSLALICINFSYPNEIGRILGSSDHLLPLVTGYMKWFVPSLMFELWIAVGCFALRIDGAPKTAMWSSIISAGTNFFLDWLFIFPFGWGIEGASLATLLSCIAGSVPVMGYLFFKAKNLRFSPVSFSFRFFKGLVRNSLEQCRLGFSAFLGESTMAVLMYLGNLMFIRHLGDNGVAAFGVACYYLPYVFMIGNSIAQAGQPIISFNFGIQNYMRIGETFRLTLKTSVICGLISSVAFIFCPDILIRLFISPESPAGEIAQRGFPFFGTAFVFFILNLSVIGYFQSMERIRPAVGFSVLRGFILLIPAFILLPFLLGEKGLWLALPFSEFLTFGAFLLFAALERR